ncbi:MAG: HAD-IA family hydrolase [Clostridia bacterium]|nr:HAD-IA family hydrolase [Clostridia bacterium]
MSYFTKFKCIVLDHDDTTVNSSPEVNYPAFLDTLSKLRPGVTYTYDSFVSLCSDPGFDGLFRGILGFSDSEMEFESSNWLRFSEETIPSPFPGIAELISRQRAAGGIVCVVSHSWRSVILKVWNAHFGTEPDAVYDWNEGEGRRKPDPFPLFDICDKFRISPSDILVVDDAIPGRDMALAAGARYAAAGWAKQAPAVLAALRAGCDGDLSRYFDSVKELMEYIFNE